jgi:hypothetical protein
MNCPNGLRTRAIIERNTAIFESVPEIQCNIMVKGGPPLRFSGITSGTYTCMSSNSSLICTKH